VQRDPEEARPQASVEGPAVGAAVGEVIVEEHREALPRPAGGTAPGNQMEPDAGTHRTLERDNQEEGVRAFSRGIQELRVSVRAVDGAWVAVPERVKDGHTQGLGQRPRRRVRPLAWGWSVVGTEPPGHRPRPHAGHNTHAHRPPSCKS